MNVKKEELELFNSQSGFFHFVFANNDNYYYTDTLIKLSFKSYLIYQLKRDDYEHIYMIERAKGAGDAFKLKIIGGSFLKENPTGKNGLFRKLSSLFTNTDSSYSAEESLQQENFVKDMFLKNGIIEESKNIVGTLSKDVKNTARKMLSYSRYR